jgi:hypothetical protein
VFSGEPFNKLNKPDYYQANEYAMKKEGHCRLFCAIIKMAM